MPLNNKIIYNNINNIIIYNTSAGSGKTYKIIFKYLCLILSNKDYNYFMKIIVLTFTNKGVNELKRRIHDYLFNISYNYNNKDIKLFLLKLSAILLINIKKIIYKAKNILTCILNNYDYFNIYTIDNFSNILVQKIRFKNLLTSNVNISKDEVLFYKESLNIFLSSLNEKDKYYLYIIDFIIDKIKKKSFFNNVNDLRDLINIFNEKNFFILKHVYYHNVDDFILLKNYINSKLLKIRIFLKNESYKALEYIKNRNIFYKSFYRSLLPNFFHKFYNELVFEPSFKNPLNNSLIISIRLNKFYAKHIDQSQKKIIDRSCEFLLKKYYMISSYYNKYISDYILLFSIKNNLYFLGLLKKINSLLATIKKDNNVIFISDFNYIIYKYFFLNKDIIKNDIFFNISYIYYFIDEFQDTSYLQWKYIFHLITVNEFKNTIFMSGDIKQSLYRWRNANPDYFINLIYRKDLIKRFNKKIKYLNINYRSHYKIVHFNNVLFCNMSKFFLKKYYNKLYLDTIKQKVNKKCECGYVEVNLFDKDTYLKDLYNRVMGIISLNIRQGYHYKDLVVLVRKNREVDILLKLFKYSNVLFSSEDTILLNNFWCIKCIIYIIKLLSTHYNNRELKIKLLSLLIHNNKIYVLKDKIHFIFKKYLSLNIDVFFNSLHEFDINFKYDLTSTLSIYDLVQLIIKSFKLYNIYNICILDNFLDFVLDFVKLYNTSILIFLNYWDKKKSTLTISCVNNLNVIKILTIHKSKGLEFPVVILPFLDWDIINKNNNDSVWIKNNSSFLCNLKYFYIKLNKYITRINSDYKKLYYDHFSKYLFDNFNLLYVSTTRSIEKLYLFVNQSKLLENNISFYINFFLNNQNFLIKNNNKYTFGNDVRCIHYKNKLLLKNCKKYTSVILNDNDKYTSNIVIENKFFFKKNSNFISSYIEVFHETISQIYCFSDFKRIMLLVLFRSILDIEQYLILLKRIFYVLINRILYKFFMLPAISFCERELIIENNIFKPDRITFLNKKVYILDYKTGVFNKEHILQIRKYAAGLKMMGYRDIYSFLVYFDNKICNIKILYINYMHNHHVWL